MEEWSFGEMEGWDESPERDGSPERWSDGAVRLAKEPTKHKIF